MQYIWFVYCAQGMSVKITESVEFPWSFRGSMEYPQLKTGTRGKRTLLLNSSNAGISILSLLYGTMNSARFHNVTVVLEY